MSEQKSQPASSSVRLRSALDAIAAYKPGKSAGADDASTFKISSNENPYPPLPSVVEAIADRAQYINRYPDSGALSLTERLAGELNVSPDQVSFATGSSGLLVALLGVTCEPGAEVIFAWRSFELYPIITALSGAKDVRVPLTEDGRHDLDAMAAAINDQTRLIILCSPNNPTGPVIHQDELDAFLAKVPAHLPVVIDEAYVEFIRDDQALDSLAAVEKYPNVVVVRTFSKAYGLAGLRIGYAVASPEVTVALRKAIPPFGVSDLAQAAAMASLDHRDELNQRVEDLVQQREQVVNELSSIGLKLPQTQSNFVWLPLGERAVEFAEFAAERGLIVRPFPGEGVRCTIAETEANKRLIDVVREFVG